MSFLAPLALVAGAVAAAAVVALHLLTTRRPPAMPLPTARFVPLAEARAIARAARPTDLLLLGLRVAAVLLIGAAFARPVLDAAGPPLRSVVMLDISSTVADPVAAMAAARSRLTVGGALIVFDTAAREVSADSLDRFVAPRDGARSAGANRSPAQGALSPALALARRVGARVARGADSVRLVLVAPVTLESLDAATADLRRAWPAGVEVVRFAAASDTGRAEAPRLVTTLADDPLAPALVRLPRSRGTHAVRVVRGPATAADSAWAHGAARVLVVWPLVSNEIVAPDGVAALSATTTTLVAPLARLPVPAGPSVVARWRDGAPAAVQAPLGDGCVRTVGVGVPLAGDLTLRAPFTRFLAAMLEPCAGHRGIALPDSALAWLAGDGGAAPSRSLAASVAPDARLAAWLLAVALLALAVEWLVRRRRPA